MEPALTKMTDEEKGRNTHGPHRMYEWTDEDLGTFPSSLPGSFPDVRHNRAKWVVHIDNAFAMFLFPFTNFCFLYLINQ